MGIHICVLHKDSLRYRCVVTAGLFSLHFVAQFVHCSFHRSAVSQPAWLLLSSLLTVFLQLSDSGFPVNQVSVGGTHCVFVPVVEFCTSVKHKKTTNGKALIR